MTTARDILRGLSRGARVVAPFIPDEGKGIAEAIAEAIGFAADLADGRTGYAVAIEIRAMRSSHPLLRDVKRHWEQLLHDRYPESAPDSDATPTAVSSDPYPDDGQ